MKDHIPLTPCRRGLRCGLQTTLKSECPCLGERPKTLFGRKVAELMVGIPRRLAENSSAIVCSERNATLELEICWHKWKRSLDVWAQSVPHFRHSSIKNIEPHSLLFQLRAFMLFRRQRTTR